MTKKDEKKFDQAISAPYFQPQVGSTVAERLRGFIASLFGTGAADPSADEIIEYHLTPREREVAYLAALGFNDKEIADSLGLTFQVVQTHIRSTLNKLQLDHRNQLSNYFTPHGRW